MTRIQRVPERAAVADPSYIALLDEAGVGGATRDWAERFAAGSAARCRWDAAFVAERCAGSADRPLQLVNVGALPLLFEHELRRLRPEMSITSLDLDPDRMARVGQLLDVDLVRLDVESEDPPPEMVGAFDVVVFNEVLEHLRIDIPETMRRLASMMTPDGLMVLATPNGFGVIPLMTQLVRRTSGPALEEWNLLRDVGHMGHVREYTTNEVDWFVRAAGLEIDEVVYRDRDLAEATPFERFARGVRTAVTTVAPSFGDTIVVTARRR